MLNQSPFDDELLVFGMPWHGLVASPKEGDAYIQLSSGRRVYAPGVSQTGANTFLIDHGLPVPDADLPDPEASLWPRYIASRSHVDGNQLSFWAGLAGGADGLMVKTPNGWRRWYANPVLFSNTRVTVMTSIPGIQRFIPFADLGVPQGQVVYYSQVLLDISKDGKRWLYGFYQVLNGPQQVQVRIDGTEETGLLAVYEVAANADLTDFTVSVLATYEQCRTGIEITRVDAAPYQHLILYRTITGGAETGTQVMPAGSPPPYPLCATSSADPCSDAMLFSQGESQSQIVREYVVGAWYQPNGTPELAEISVSWTVSGSSTLPTPGPGGWFWQNYTQTVEIEVTSITPSSDGDSLLSLTSQEIISPEGYNNSVTIGDRNYSRTSPSVDYSQHQSGGHKPPEDAEIFIYSGSNFAFNWYSGFPSGPEIEVRGLLAGWTSSNKVIGSMLRVWEAGTSQEFIAGPALTPSGLSPGYKTSGDIFGGHNTGYEPFDEALWDQHAWFSYGTYNPVTGQTIRNERGPTAYSWV